MGRPVEPVVSSADFLPNLVELPSFDELVAEGSAGHSIRVELLFCTLCQTTPDPVSGICRCDA